MHVAEKTNSRCVVCQGMIVKRLASRVKMGVVNDMSEPIPGTIAYTESQTIEGYHCSACGLEYYKLPTGSK